MQERLADDNIRSLCVSEGEKDEDKRIRNGLWMKNFSTFFSEAVA